MKKLLALFMAICLVFSLCSCTFLKDVSDSGGIEKPKIFEFDGISIELTTDFLRMDFISEEYDFVIGNDGLTVMGMKVPFEDNTDISVMDYAETFHSAFSSYNPTKITQIEDIPTFQYVIRDKDDDLRAAVTFYKGTDCFWVILFTEETDDFNEHYSDICKYAKSVKCE